MYVTLLILGICDNDNIKYIAFTVEEDKAGSILEALQCFEVKLLCFILIIPKLCTCYVTKELKVNIVDLKTRTFISKDRTRITIHVKCELPPDFNEDLKSKLESAGAKVTIELANTGAGKINRTACVIILELPLITLFLR